MPEKSAKPRPAGTTHSDKFQAPEHDRETLDYHAEAPVRRPQRKLHARRHIPLVPQGPVVPDVSPTEPVDHPSLRGILSTTTPSPEDLVIALQTELDSAADNDTASQVCEPSAAANEDVVFYTGNWFAAVSTDGGHTFQYVDPSTAFPEPPGMRFCCDQVVQYIPQIDTFVWLLQYMIDAEGKNIQRLAFATTENVRLGKWWTMDISAASLGLPDLFLDFPDITFGQNMLYMSTNGFSRSESLFDEYEWACSVVLRLPLEDIRKGDVVGETVINDENFNFRVAQHCGERVYWATHENTSTLRVYSWEEDETEAAYFDIPVATWTGGNGYISKTPDGYNWLRRIDPRVLGATKSGNTLYFAWSVDRGGINDRPHPYIQLARINTVNMRLLNNLSIWDEKAATAYPALSTNSAREVGCGYFVGGGNRYPSHALSLLTRTRQDLIAAESVRGPSQQRWGDFVSMRRHYPHDRLFVSTGYVLKSGEGEQDSTANYTIFGRRREVEAAFETESVA